MKLKNLNRAIVAIAMMLIGILPSMAYDFEVDGIYYQIINETNEVRVTSYTGNETVDSSHLYSGDIIIPANVIYEGEEYKVSSIGAYAFKNCSELTSIKIPDSITHIGTKTFSECEGLTSITIPNSITTIEDRAFLNCYSLSSVELPNSLTSIATETFSGCKGLTSITIPNSIATIEDGAFLNCSSLSSVELPNSITSIATETFSGCHGLTSITIPNSVTTIGVCAFRGCSSLSSIELPDSLTHIGTEAFHGIGLTSITIPDSVVEIGQSAFAGSMRLININLGNGVKIIRKSAFEVNSYPSGVLTIPSSVEIIENYAFRYCNYDVCNILCETPPTIQESSFSNLKTIIVPLGSKELYQNAKYWSDAETIIENGSVEIAINNTVAGELMKSIVDQYRKTPATVTKLVVSGTINDTDIMNINSNMTSLLYLDISNTDCTQLPSEAFKGKSTLMTILLPEQLETIGDKSFYGCKSLCNEIICPESVTSIGKNAFEGCSSLKSVILPPQLESIEQGLFSGCTNITNIDLSKCSLLTEIGTDAFNNTVELRKLDLSNCKSLTTLNYGAFRKCGIEELDLSMCNASVIDSEMFYECRNLKNILLPESISEIKNDAFYMCDALENVDFSNCELLENIGYCAFMDCYALKNLELSECINLTAIDDGAFSNCTSIETINFPDSLLSIGFGAFENCSALKSINFPDSNLTIEGYAFAGATSLIHMSLPSSTPPTTGDNPFKSVDNLNCVISVPTDSFYDYLSAQYWGSFISIEDKEEIKISVDKTDSESNDITDTDNSKGGCEIKYDKNHDKNKHGLPMKSATRANDSNSEQFFAITSSGSSIFAAENNYISFQITPDEGYEIDKLMFNDVDVTSELIDNVFTTPATSAGYINSFKISLVKTTDSVNNIELSDNYDIKIVGNNIVAPDNAAVYNLNGIKVNTQNLSSGIYIVVIENKPFKVIIK